MVHSRCWVDIGPPSLVTSLFVPWIFLYRLPQTILLTATKTCCLTLAELKLQMASHWANPWCWQGCVLPVDCKRGCISMPFLSTCLGLFPFSPSKPAITSLPPLNFLVSHSDTLPPSSEGGILPWWRQILCNPPIQMFISSKNTFSKQPETVFPQLSWHSLVQSSYYIKLTTMDVNKTDRFGFQCQHFLYECNILVIGLRLIQVEFLNVKNIIFCAPLPCTHHTTRYLVRNSLVGSLDDFKIIRKYKNIKNYFYPSWGLLPNLSWLYFVCFPCSPFTITR